MILGTPYIVRDSKVRNGELTRKVELPLVFYCESFQHSNRKVRNGEPVCNVELPLAFGGGSFFFVIICLQLDITSVLVYF